MRRPHHALLSTEALMDIISQTAAPTYAQSLRKRNSRGLSLRLARKYGVSQRAIRDVWNGRTWTGFTAAMCAPPSDDWLLHVFRDDI